MHLLVCELRGFQNARSNDKNYVVCLMKLPLEAQLSRPYLFRDIHATLIQHISNSLEKKFDTSQDR